MSSVPDTPEIPTRIGPYQILEPLGAGGFGAVYLAEQTEPVRRKVALKVLHPGMDSRDFLARFEAERESLALMSQEYIARLLDAGMTEDQKPYLVMEYVPGIPLVDYAERERLDLNARLDLFLKVCEAIQHAHQKGVIHRDLSAKNVLVMEVDGKAVPKIIDFGIAKSLAGPLADQAVHTMHGQIMGTPEYMSPEQAAGRVEEIDTRTDIYALGLQLYQLLTGELPFEAEQLRRKGFHAMQKVILEQEPTRPSERVSTQIKSGKSPARSEPAIRKNLARSLRGDLDWITCKALAKERHRRYPSVTDLADDIRRFLRGDAVEAGPPDPIYRLRKFVHRHRWPVALAVSVFVSLVVGLIVALTQYARARDYAAQAEQNAKAAEASERVARAALEDFDRLKDLVLLAELRAEADAMWPAHPRHVADYRDWLGRAGQLTTRLEGSGGHREALHALRARASGPAGAANAADDPVFRTDHEEYLHRTLVKLVDELDEFTLREDGPLKSVLARLDWARRVRGLSITDHAPAWQRAIAEIRDDARFENFTLTPQLGLVPLGPDPDSRLQEFVHLRTGDPGSIPRRGLDGRLGWTRDAGLIFVLLPGGKFPMGRQRDDQSSGNYDPRAWPEDRPVVERELAPFFLSKFEMSQMQWQEVTGRNPSHYVSAQNPDYYLDHPIEKISWIDCDRVLSQLGLVLPTEAQWEYACRAGTDTYWSFGKDFEELEAPLNFADAAARDFGVSWPSIVTNSELRDGHVQSAPVDAFRPNAFGLYNMHGNVWEWCRERWGPYNTAFRPGDGLREEEYPDQPGRVVRGGSYYTALERTKTRYRNWHPESQSALDIGVRPARPVRNGAGR